MTNKIKRKITIQTRQVTLVQPLSVRCHRCGAEVPILTADDVAGRLHTTPSEIQGLLESGDLHTVQEPADQNLICGNSLSAAANQTDDADPFVKSKDS
jgi:hypothetical protein